MAPAFVKIVSRVEEPARDRAAQGEGRLNHRGGAGAAVVRTAAAFGALEHRALIAGPPCQPCPITTEPSVGGLTPNEEKLRPPGSDDR